MKTNGECEEVQNRDPLCKFYETATKCLECISGYLLVDDFC